MSARTPLLKRYQRLVGTLALLARSSHAVGAVAQTVHEQAGTLFSAHVTLLALRETSGDWRWELYEEDRRLTQRLPFDPGGLLERVLREGPLSVPDIDAYLDAHPQRVRRIVSESEVLLNIRADGALPPPPGPSLSMLYVPLEVRGEMAGVLSVQSQAVGAFDETDLEFLELLGQHVAIALENATLREELTRASLTDPLTGLPNRRAFDRDIERALRPGAQESRPCLVLMDVHRFKHYNDTLGHAAGDDVLCALGRALRRVTGERGRAYRLGGDEFALLLPARSQPLAALAAQLEGELRAECWPPGTGPVRLQAGAAPGRPGLSAREWLAQADAQLYRAKHARREEHPPRWGLDFGPES